MYLLNWNILLRVGALFIKAVGQLTLLSATWHVGELPINPIFHLISFCSSNQQSQAVTIINTELDRKATKHRQLPICKCND